MNVSASNIAALLAATVLALNGCAASPTQSGAAREVPRFEVDRTWPKLPEKWASGFTRGPMLAQGLCRTCIDQKPLAADFHAILLSNLSEAPVVYGAKDFEHSFAGHLRRAPARIRLRGRRTRRLPRSAATGPFPLRDARRR